MAKSQPTHEARIRALESALHPGNPGRDVSLKEHFEVRIAALERATSVASEAMDKRLDGMNEFRDTLRDQASRFITEKEVISQLDAIKAQINALEKFQAIIESKASMNAVYLSYLIGIVGLIIGIVGLLK